MNLVGLKGPRQRLDDFRSCGWLWRWSLLIHGRGDWTAGQATPPSLWGPARSVPWAASALQTGGNTSGPFDRGLPAVKPGCWNCTEQMGLSPQPEAEPPLKSRPSAGHTLIVFTVKLGKLFKQHYVSKSLPETWCFHIISEIFARDCQDVG